MQTNEFITYMSQRLNADLSREQILDMTNKAQNEILAHDNRITRINPDPEMHVGSDTFNSGLTNGIGDPDFRVTQTIPLTVPTQGYLLVTENGITDKYHYVSYIGSIFILADGILLNKAYSTAATTIVDNFDIFASGALFSSVKNEPRIIQWDVRRVTRVYAFTTNLPGQPYYGYYGGYGYFNGAPGSRRPDAVKNLNDNEVDVTCDTTESKEPNTGDCEVVIWQDNAPPTNPSQSVYFARAQRWANQLLTEDIPLEIPDRFHTNLLRYGILKDEEYREYGRDDYPEQQYDKYLADFLTWAQSGASSSTKNWTTPRF